MNISLGRRSPAPGFVWCYTDSWFNRGGGGTCQAVGALYPDLSGAPISEEMLL